MDMTRFGAMVVLALVACSPAPGPKPAPREAATPVVDAAVAPPPSEKPLPAIEWRGAALIVDAHWSLDTMTWNWTALAGNRDARTPRITFPEAPGARAEGGVRDPSGERVAWPEPGRVCLQVNGVAGYSCAMVPPRPTE